ncbi:hypothetical protein PROFUN_05520 [Planoprotostelium fungivorum]|uniref:Uncharacterized protein n=1 Tax=Planoprotostelium fungivorum TaxID=1890364 RepID=A0A2P6NQY8_9EUKA|nr:hypothetical protein PROFUN_05520 [Planoprotostelium fungivorum]
MYPNPRNITRAWEGSSSSLLTSDGDYMGDQASMDVWTVQLTFDEGCRLRGYVGGSSGLPKYRRDALTSNCLGR